MKAKSDKAKLAELEEEIEDYRRRQVDLVATYRRNDELARELHTASADVKYWKARAEAAEAKLAKTEAALDECRQSFNRTDARANQLREMVKIQCQDGNWNYDSYMHGMANGLLLAMSAIDGSAFEGLSAPEQWLAAADTEADHD